MVSALAMQLKKPERAQFLKGEQRQILLKGAVNDQGVLATTAAVKELREHNEAFRSRSKKSLRASMIHWFQAEDLTNAPRRGAASGLTADEEQFLLRALTVETYADGQGNKRRHSSFVHFRRTRQLIVDDSASTATERSNAQQNIDALARAAKASGKTYKALLRWAVKRFGLRKVRERFKTQRYQATCQALAQTLVGRRDMTEMYYSTEEPSRYANTYELTPPNRAKVMRRIVPRPPNARFAQPRTEALRFDEGAWQITGCLDGCTVMLKADDDSDARWVYVQVCC